MEEKESFWVTTQVVVAYPCWLAATPTCIQLAIYSKGDQISSKHLITTKLILNSELYIYMYSSIKVGKREKNFINKKLIYYVE